MKINCSTFSMKIYLHIKTKTKTKNNRDNDIKVEEIELGRRLGRGAFAQVYLGRLRDETVAVKVLDDDAIDDAVRAAQIKEVRLMQSLPAHRHVVALRGYALAPEKIFICLEYCSGGSLLDYLNAHKTSIN